MFKRVFKGGGLPNKTFPNSLCLFKNLTKIFLLSPFSNMADGNTYILLFF